MRCAVPCHDLELGSVATQPFLAPLDAEQFVAMIVEELIAVGRYHDAMAVADILIDHYPMIILT